MLLQMNSSYVPTTPRPSTVSPPSPPTFSVSPQQQQYHQPLGFASWHGSTTVTPLAAASFTPIVSATTPKRGRSNNTHNDSLCSTPEPATTQPQHRYTASQDNTTGTVNNNDCATPNKKARSSTYIASRPIPKTLVSTVASLVSATGKRPPFRRQLSGGQLDPFLGSGDQDAMDVEAAVESRPRSMSF